VLCDWCRSRTRWELLLSSTWADFITKSLDPWWPDHLLTCGFESVFLCVIVWSDRVY